MKKVGLTLGKFAPFHKGHEYIVQIMSREMDEVIVVIYDTPITPIPLPIRVEWIT
jgi:cytidyltransferase-like protein